MFLRRFQIGRIFRPLFRSPNQNPYKNSKASTLPMMASNSNSWSCAVCTYVNPSPSSSSSSSSSLKPTCQICLSPQPSSFSLSSSSSSPFLTKPKWSCKACTFLNPYDNTTCDVCGTRVSASLLSTVEVDDSEVDGLGSAVGNVFLPLRACRNSGSINTGSGKNDKEIVLEKNSAADSQNLDHFGQGGGFRGLKACSNSSSISTSSGGKNKRKAVEENSVADADDSSAGGFKGLKACSNSISISASSGGKDKRKVMEESSVVDAVGFDQLGGSGFRVLKAARKEVESTDDTKASHKPLKILSYNVWFREDLEMHKRMKAIGDLIQLHSPDIICFQEVTPNIYDILQQSHWWKLYSCSVSNEEAFTRGYFCMQLSKLPVKSYSCKPFANSIMGRELCVAEVDAQAGTPLLVATSHLESPCPAPPRWDQMFSKERVIQAKHAIKLLEENPNVIFCGDMNWDDKLDGQFPLPDGWVDAWVQLRPSENGWTYDTKTNKMLTGNRTLQKRLDRFVCSLQDFKIKEIQMIGTDEIPGLSYCKEKKVKSVIKNLMLPVLPSDHYGLLLTISPQC